MSDEIHPLSRREGPVPPPEPRRRVVPLDESLPDVCVSRKACFARHVQSEGGMAWLLGGLVFQWALYAVVWAVGVIWWWGPPGLALMSGVTLPLLLLSFVVYRRRGHRGRCWILRSLDPGEVAEALSVLLAPFAWIESLFVWVLWPFRWIGRLFVWIWTCLSALGDL
ncbi:hypothetical protein [Streptosporangium carneum]|uniref:Uncharacterized protein n=1 Tax=Streptosporangium carneum TaxID=47481 RepID=A0A9W6HZI2_9ACTN|nr:hypothetical protein [Streptosporangium carneum]GLK08519.1 hypothetical protein GCM10017600_19240 [Streptosporangium carneum]